MIKEYLRLSWSNIRSRRLRSWLTMLGVVIGIAAVISLIGLGQGLRNFVAAQFNVIDADVLRIDASGLQGQGPPGTGVVNPLTDKELEAVRDVKGVKTAVGRIIESGVIEFNDRAEIAFFASLPDGAYRKDVVDIANYKIEQGRQLKDGDTTRIVVGHDYTDPDKFGESVQLNSKILINGTAYTVIGILKKEGSFIVDNSILMNEEPLRAQFNTPKDEYDTMAARIVEGLDPREVKERIERTLRNVRNVEEGEEDFSVETAEAALESLNKTLFAVQLFVYIIAGISIVVGGIGIMNTMFTAVLERTKDIGIMKATGAPNKVVFTLFFLESGLIGLIGGGIGVLLGTMTAYGLAAGAAAALGQDMIQASVSLWLIAGAMAFSFIIGTVAGVLPAVRAAKMSPVEALSYEK